MKPRLVIGLGNPLMSDDGVGCAAAAQLARDTRLPESVEVICGGTDLLRHAGRMVGREQVIIIDAIQSDGEPGSVALLDRADPSIEARQEHAHHLSAVQAVRLLEMTTSTRFALVAISISSAGIGSALSPALADRMPAIVDRLLQELDHTPG